MVRAHTALLAQSSVAVQVLVTLYVLAQVPAEVTSAKVIVTLWSHTSVAVAAPKLGEAGQSIGDVTVGHVITGPVTSSVQVQVLAHVAVLPHTSVAVHVIVLDRPQALVLTILPAEQVTTGVPQLSVATGAAVLAQVGIVGLHPKLLPAGQDENTGKIASLTLNTWQHTICPASQRRVSHNEN